MIYRRATEEQTAEKINRGRAEHHQRNIRTENRGTAKPPTAPTETESDGVRIIYLLYSDKLI